MNWEQTLHFEWQVNVWVSGKALKEKGNDKLSLSFPTPCSCISFCVPFARDFSWYPLNGELARRLLWFSLFWEIWLHSHYNGSVNSKHTHTPKSICQVLTSPLALDIWARADKIAQTLVCTWTHKFQSLLRDLSPIIGRNHSVSR